MQFEKRIDVENADEHIPPLLILNNGRRSDYGSKGLIERTRLLSQQTYEVVLMRFLSFVYVVAKGLYIKKYTKTLAT
ncbi:hypothetical protein [Calothrix sp. CCY 0018]|uniref:hypothetical protein n=1 Tax=Calothrix sp. CCY 0018 TaxID=3103864 RepID=UPI0039C6A107